MSASPTNEDRKDRTSSSMLGMSTEKNGVEKTVVLPGSLSSLCLASMYASLFVYGAMCMKSLTCERLLAISLLMYADIV